MNTFTYTYDSSGNELTAANNAGTYTMTYNNNNDVATMQGLYGVTLTESDDATGNRTGLPMANSNTVSRTCLGP